MAGRLDGKGALITGGARGQGAADDRELRDRIIAMNQTGVYLGLAAVAPVMVNQRDGGFTA